MVREKDHHQQSYCDEGAWEFSWYLPAGYVSGLFNICKTICDLYRVLGWSKVALLSNEFFKWSLNDT